MPGRAIAVVGGGIIGLCTAYYCRQRGMQVTVLERGGPGYDCCSTGNAGMVVPSHFVPLAAPGMVQLGLRMLLNPEGPFALRPRPEPEFLRWAWRFYRAGTEAHVRRSAPLLRELGLESRRLFEELSGEFADAFSLVRSGLLMLCKEGHTLDEEARVAKAARELGMPAEVLDPTETAERDPGIEMDVAGSVYFPLDCHLDPARLLTSLRERLADEGVEFRTGTEAAGWRTEGERVTAVRTSGGDVPADDFVVAGGSWSARLLRSLGMRLPLEAGKGYSFTLARPAQLPRVCSILTEARVAVTPMGESLRFAGTMELAGLDLHVNPRRVEGMIHSIPRYFPRFREDDLRGKPVWSGLRPCSPDGLPYVGRTERWSNLLVATGHAMMGVSLGPVTGSLVASLLAGEAPTLDLTPLSPDRYG